MILDRSSHMKVMGCFHCQCADPLSRGGSREKARNAFFVATGLIVVFNALKHCGKFILITGDFHSLFHTVMPVIKM